MKLTITVAEKSIIHTKPTKRPRRIVLKAIKAKENGGLIVGM